VDASLGCAAACRSLSISLVCTGTLVEHTTSLNLPISQNHRMVGVGRDLCGSSGPTPLPIQDHLEQLAKDLIQEGFEYLQMKEGVKRDFN